MDKMKAIIFALLLVLMSPAAFALVWQEPYWLPLGTADPNTVAFGGTATAASGAFGSLDTVVHYRAELRRASGDLIKVLEEHDVDISTITGFETVEIAQADYVAGGEYFVRFTVSDSRQTESKLLRLTVLAGPENHPPVLNFISDKSVYENQLLQFSVSGSDPDGDRISFSAANLPSGATFNPVTRTFTWVPGNDQAGVYNVIFIVTDEHGATDSQTVTITVLDVNRCPVLAPVGDRDVDEGELLTFSVSATDADADALTYSVSRLPAGAIFSPATRTFTWMPSFTQAGIHYVTFFVTDGRCVDSETVQIFVHENSQPIVDLVADPQGGVEGTTVNFDCDVVGGDAPLSFMIDFGDGTFVYDSHATHTYAYQGLYVATCTVTDADGDRGYDATWINISRNHCPVLATLADQSVQVGNLLTFTVSATDADGDVLTYSADAPFSAYFDPIARVFSWTPIELQVGNHLATFRVTDGSCEDLQTINIEVTRGFENHAPDAEFNWTPLTPEVGEDVVFTSTSSDVDGDALTCAWDFNNDGVTDSTDCAAGWVFTTPGNHSVTLTVSDGSLSDSVTHTITVLGQLNVTSIECLSPVIENTDRQHTWQSCSIDVESNGVPVSGANVVLHYMGGTVIRNCITDSITGACTVTFAPGAPGNYTVYATAEKAGWIPDLDTVPTEDFVVLAQRYYISNLDVYNDSAFMNWDVDFFRGENMYVSFMVVDGSGNPIDGMVTSVALVSPPGGIAWFEAFPYASPEAGTYYYVLRIPTTHDFLGDSQVFTFAFNFTDGSGAEMVVEVIIRNNPPVIDEAVVGEFSGVFNSTEVINLTPYESDVEDSGAALTWSVLGVDSSIAIVTVDANDQLTVTPVSEGYDIITLVLRDLDGDTDMIDNISINTGVVVPDVTQCNDGLDNDGDNRTDYPDDVGCSGLLDDNESDHPVVPPVLLQCNDGLDNDGDGLVDYPADPGCENAADDNETNPTGRGLAISDVWLSASEVEAGRSIAAVVIVANRGIVDEYDVRVTFDIPALGLRALPDYMDIERSRVGVSEELYLRIPITAVVGNYTCVFTARSFDGLVVSTRNETITVLAHSPGTHPQCSDGLDNDGDGLVDYPADPGCENASDNDESNHVPVLPQCNDGLDNDGDNRTDYPDDVGCSGLLDDNESDHPIVPPVLPQCNDGIDNDHDGFTDMNDTDCVTPSDNSEHYLPQCMDGIDNDLDGKIDWPADVHCASSSDPYEGEIRIREGKKVFHDMDDIIVTRIDINGNDIDRAVVEPGNYVRFSVGLQNNLNYDLKDIKVEAAIYELGARDTDMIRSLDVDDSATVVFNMDIPEDAAPGLYDVRVVVSNNDVRRVKYRTLVVA